MSHDPIYTALGQLQRAQRAAARDSRVRMTKKRIAAALAEYVSPDKQEKRTSDQ